MARAKEGAAKPMSLIEKLTAALIKGGISSRKAAEAAKSVAPVARRAVKAELAAKEVATMPAIEAQEAQVATEGDALPMQGAKGADLLQVMHGRTSYRSYRVVAVKGEDLLIAVRKLWDDTFNVKFYPSMDAWGFKFERLAANPDSHICRPEYERCYMSAANLDELLVRINKAAGPAKKRRGLAGRMKAVAMEMYEKVMAAVA